MSDDDLNKGASDSDFEFEGDDEFNLPETPDDELIGGDDDDLLAGELNNDDLADLDVEDNTSNDADDDAWSPEARDDTDAHEDEREGAGWKLWASVGVAMVAVFSGLMWFSFGVLGGGSSSADAQTETRSFQTTTQESSAPKKQNVKPSPTAHSELKPDNVASTKMAPQPDASGPVSAGVRQNEPTSQANVLVERDSLPTPGGQEPLSQSGPTGEPDYGREVAKNQMFPPIDGGALKGLKTALIKNGNQIESLSNSLSASIDDSGDKIDRRLSDVTKKLSDIANKLDAIDSRSAKQSASSPLKTEKSGKTTAETKAQRKRVRMAQIRLKAFGYRPGAIDGLFGGHTAAAAKRFQRQNDLTVTGELDGPTMSQLMSSKVTPYTASTPASVTTRRPDVTSPVKKAPSPLVANQWYVRGVTADRAIIYQSDGSSYLVQSGTEVPGKGQVSRLNPGQHSITLVGGEVIRRQ